MGNIIIDMPNKKLQSVFEQEFGMEFNPTRPSASEQKFIIFHEANPEVYELFKKFTFQAMNRGHKHLSAEMIINRIRWETKVVTTDEAIKTIGKLKINNDYKPFYSRLFIVEHPQHKDFFRLRQSVADNLGGA